MEWSAEYGRYIDPQHPDRRASAPRPQRFIWRALLFFALFACMQLAWNLAQGGWFEYWIVHDVTVSPSAWLINLLTPAVHVSAQQFSLRAVGGGLNILNGCEGLDALFLLVSAFMVAPLSWRPRLTGLLLGIPMVYVINQARILVLFYAYRTDPALFDPLHGFVTPLAVVLLVAAYFYLWMTLSDRRAASA